MFELSVVIIDGVIQGDCFMLEDHQFKFGHRREGNLDITTEGKGRNTWICIKCGKKERDCKVGGFHEPKAIC